LAIHIDFQQASSSSELTSLDATLRSLAYAIANEIGVQTTSIDQIWYEPTGPKLKITKFLESQVLEKAKRPVFLLIDEADAVLDRSFHADFFGLFRAWNNKSAFDELWKKLNVIMAISTHPAVLIKDARQSPFNVGLRLQLGDFTEREIQALNVAYKSPLSVSDILAAQKLLGGHPYLIQQALYTLVHEQMAWADLEKVAAQANGPFDAHLRYHMELLKQDPECVQAAKAILASNACPPPEIQQKLVSAGLIKVEGDRCSFRYGLYKRYFGDQLT
jgi:serine/threonine-protein kinase